MPLRLKNITEFKEWVGDAMSSVISSFDMGFINMGYERLGFGPSTNGVIDTSSSGTINTEYGKHGLNFLAKKYGVINATSPCHL